MIIDQSIILFRLLVNKFADVGGMVSNDMIKTIPTTRMESTMVNEAKVIKA